jgi:hypothetical protein
MKPYLWILFALLFTGVCLAQEPPAAPAGNPQQENAIPVDERNQPISSTAQDAIPVPIQEPQATTSRGGQTFLDDVFQSSRNRLGFSLSAYGAYSSDVSSRSDQQEDSFITSFMPRVFVNLGRSRSRFHFDLGTGYRRYLSNSELNSWDYFGNAQYSYRFSRRTSLNITNQFTSSYNDSSSFISQYSPLQRDYLSTSNEILFNRQRITRNALDADLTFQMNRKARFGITGGYNFYQYSQDTLTGSHVFRVVGAFDYELNRWLRFSSSYQRYLNEVDELNREAAQIQRLQIGGLDFRLTRYWRLWAGGGIEYSYYRSRNQFEGSVNAGISYTAREASMSVTYQRGLTSAIGLVSLLQSDMLSAEFGYRLTSRVSTRINGYYNKNREVDSVGTLTTLSGGGGFEFALRRDLILTLNSYYQNQKEDRFSYEGLGLNRISAYVGLQYVWPSRTRGDY